MSILEDIYFNSSWNYPLFDCCSTDITAGLQTTREGGSEPMITTALTNTATNQRQCTAAY